MANYSLVLNSKFKPFSYDEMLKPLLLDTQAHQAIETQYSDLASKANIWENLANEQTDPQAHELYKNYSKDLAAQAESLAKEGLTPASRQAMLSMKNRYSTEIIPIEQAYERRANDIKTTNELKAKGFLIENDPVGNSLDNYLRDPSYNYGNTLNVNQLNTELTNEYKALSRELRNNPRNFKNILNGQYYQSMQKYGFTAQEVENAMNHGDTSILRKILLEKVSGTGYDYWNGMRDANTGELTELGNRRLNDLYNRLEGSMTNAIGTVTTKELANRDFGSGSNSRGSKGTTSGSSRYESKYMTHSNEQTSQKIKEFSDNIERAKAYLKNNEEDMMYKTVTPGVNQTRKQYGYSYISGLAKSKNEHGIRSREIGEKRTFVNNLLKEIGYTDEELDYLTPEMALEELENVAIKDVLDTKMRSLRLNEKQIDRLTGIMSGNNAKQVSKINKDNYEYYDNSNNAFNHIKKGGSAKSIKYGDLLFDESKGKLLVKVPSLDDEGVAEYYEIDKGLLNSANQEYINANKLAFEDNKITKAKERVERIEKKYRSNYDNITNAELVQYKLDLKTIENQERFLDNLVEDLFKDLESITTKNTRI